ncbi:MAG: hypothetical protein Q4C81_04470 [Kocuria sp.]|nr:hypothetical protein [Kocuria sp.]
MTDDLETDSDSLGVPMRLDVMTAAAKYGCSDAAIRRLFKSGGIEGRYETVEVKSGPPRRKLTFDEADLAKAFAGPLLHLAKHGSESLRLESEVAAMSPEERKRLEERLDVPAAAEECGVSEAKIRQHFGHGRLRGEKTPFRDRSGRMSLKLTFTREDLWDCFKRDVEAHARHEAHVAAIRAAAKPFSEEQKKAIAGVFIDHLREKRELESAEISDGEELEVSEDEMEIATAG